MEKEKLAPWEVENGFDAEGQSIRTHFSRSQWRAKGRMVLVGNADAVRVIVARNGYTLHLFSVDQTRERRPHEM